MAAKKRQSRSGKRQAFDPSKMRPAPSLFEQAAGDAGPSDASDPPTTPAARARDDRFTVSQLAGMIDAALRDGLPSRVSVVGEISGFTDRTHWYFSLKDDSAVLDCVMFASSARRCSFRPANGVEVIARGRVEHYARQGRTQLYVDRLEPVGEGALELKYRELVRELKGQGWFDPERKRPLPRFPRRVAVVTSRTGAAWRDVIDTFGRRAPFIPLLLVDTRVQGERAAPQIAAAVRLINRRRKLLGVDAVILTRGGGSMEDLWAFNEREVAEAIHRSELPIVAAIGHETDTTIAELVADERAATPTQAAMRLSPDRDALWEQVEQLRARLSRTAARRIEHDAQRVQTIARHPALSDPRAAMNRGVERIDALDRSLRRAARSHLGERRVSLSSLVTRLSHQRPSALVAERGARIGDIRRRLRSAMALRITRGDPASAHRRLQHATRLAHHHAASRLSELARTLEATGPMNVLRRGYSVTVRTDGRAVRTTADVRSGDEIETRVADGRIRSVVSQGDGADSGNS